MIAQRAVRFVLAVMRLLPMLTTGPRVARRVRVVVPLVLTHTVGKAVNAGNAARFEMRGMHGMDVVARGAAKREIEGTLGSAASAGNAELPGMNCMSGATKTVRSARNVAQQGRTAIPGMAASAEIAK